MGEILGPGEPKSYVARSTIPYQGFHNGRGLLLLIRGKWERHSCPRLSIPKALVVALHLYDNGLKFLGG
jgi:hypothetical protein